MNPPDRLATVASAAPAVASQQELQIKIVQPPLQPELQQQLFDLLWPEWQSGDYDWLQSMRGEFTGLEIAVAFGTFGGGELVGTAKVNLSATEPEVAVVGDVLTSQHARGRGVAEAMTRGWSRHPDRTRFNRVCFCAARIKTHIQRSW